MITPRAVRTKTQPIAVSAACRGLRTMMFFHPRGERGSTRNHRDAEAKAVCQRCPVIEACRRHVLQAQEPYGVWGGLPCRGTRR